MDLNAGRPARQYQWSIGFQREIMRDMVVEASYVANRDIYTTPLGNEFVVNCSPHLFIPPAIGGCDISYAFKPQLNVTYRFQPYTGSHPIPINEIINFDRGFRTQITAELVEAYPWPEQRAGELKK